MPEFERRTTVPAVQSSKVRDGDAPLAMITAYDAPSARTADAAGADMLLVGDSVAMVVLGYDDTLQVTIDDMAHHVAAVRRANPTALIVGDLPWLSYHVSTEDTVRNAATLIRAGAGAVKLEGGRKRLVAIQALLDAEIPVMGHVGLTPQSVNSLGGYKVQGRDVDGAETILGDAMALEEAGCFAIVLECVPEVLGRTITEAVSVPTIGIGAGVDCDGQVLVWHDVLGMNGDRKPPKFVRRYADLESEAVAALSSFVTDVHNGDFPAKSEVYSMPAAAAEVVELYGAAAEAVRTTS
jgi:3-methyl-2-oxobutanoate hydroxymethyltransferase